jgi:hypothetical protein
MKTSLLAAAFAVLVPAANCFAYTPVSSVFAPQPVNKSASHNVLAKKTYSPNAQAQTAAVDQPTASSVKPTFGRRPVVNQTNLHSKATTITVGATITAPARFLGSETGCVFLQVGPTMLECKIMDWKTTSVTFVVPNMGLGPVTAGRLQIVRGDGDIIRDYPIALIRKPDLIVHEEPKLMAPSTLHERVENLPQD